MLLTIRYHKFPATYIAAVGLLICFAQTTWADPCTTPTPPAPVPTGPPTGVHLNIVAHQDDDVLFMNPDILNNVIAGRRQVTVYITAGNVSPGEQAYATEREEAAIAGYSKLLQLADAKIINAQHFQDLSGTFQGDSQFPAGCDFAPAHCFPCTEHANELSGPGDARGEKTLLHIPNSRVLNGATIGDGPGGPRVTLIFLRVNSPAPDNLGQLFTGILPKIGSPFSQQSYTKGALINQLVQIINFYQPDTVRTQDPADGVNVDPFDLITPQECPQDPKPYDHSDHVWGARFAREALKKYNHNFPLGKKPDYFIYNGYNLEWNKPLANRVSTEDFCLKKSIMYRNAFHDRYIINDNGFCTDPDIDVTTLFCRTQYAVPFNLFYYWYIGYQRREQRSLP